MQSLYGESIRLIDDARTLHGCCTDMIKYARTLHGFARICTDARTLHGRCTDISWCPEKMNGGRFEYTLLGKGMGPRHLGERVCVPSEYYLGYHRVIYRVVFGSFLSGLWRLMNDTGDHLDSLALSRGRSKRKDVVCDWRKRIAVGRHAPAP